MHVNSHRAPLIWTPIVLFYLASAASGQSPPSLFSPSPVNFTTDSHIVSATVFAWYAPNGWQTSGPWQPLEGRSAWTGDVPYWEDQVKQIMSANIDVMNVELIPNFEQQQINLFQALNDLRSQGYDVPKVAPFLDPTITWSSSPAVDLATAAGKGDFVAQYTRFYNDYYSVNKDSGADSYIETIGGRPVLDTWHVEYNTANTSALTRADVSSRLTASLGAQHPVFNNHGIYMITTTTTVGPNLSFADEKLSQFDGTGYFHKTTYKGYTAAELKPGVWDQNIRNPGTFMPRDGGNHYTHAWTQVNNNPSIHHVNIESWNEYDEGSGIYRANPTPYILPGSGNHSTDTWSKTNDPLQYVKATAAGARVFNDTPDRNSQILWSNFPTQMQPGQAMDVTVIVRNEGDLSWTAAGNYKFGEEEWQHGEVLFGASRYLLNDTQNGIPTYGGIFRGAPVTFTLHLVAPSTIGTYLTHWSMLQEGVTWFGQELDWTINVVAGSTSSAPQVPEPSSFVLAAMGLTALAWRLSIRRRKRGG